MIKPNDAEVYIDASWYKIGRHGLTFFHTNGKWKSSGKEVWEIDQAIEAEELRIMKAAKDLAAQT